MLMLVDVPCHAYARAKRNEGTEGVSVSDIEQAVADGIVIEKMNRSEVHKLLFGIHPPELDSPYCACALAEEGCNKCDHKDDLNCDVNWWNSTIPTSQIKKKMEVPNENTH